MRITTANITMASVVGTPRTPLSGGHSTNTGSTMASGGNSATTSSGLIGGVGGLNISSGATIPTATAMPTSGTSGVFGTSGLFVISGSGNATMGSNLKPVPMKLFATWEVDRTPSNCIPR